MCGFGYFAVSNVDMRVLGSEIENDMLEREGSQKKDLDVLRVE